jgi:prolyl 4-hydroxylase
MIQALVAVGHDPAFARQILEDAQPKAELAAPARSATHAVPDPLAANLAEGPHVLDVSDGRITVLAQFQQPRLLVLQGVLSQAECAALIQESQPKLERSRTIDRESGGTELNAARTSEGTYFHHTESELLLRINQRIASLTRWPLENGEPLQILHYGEGAQYEPHYDYFDPADPGTPKLVSQGGQRVATLIIYLNDPQGGGATIFPDLGLEVAAVQGNAVFFSYDRPHPSTRTLHGGTAVTRGEKWIATRWMREGPYR